MFLDANILFSASHPGSATRMLVNRLLEQGSATINTYVLDEARRNLDLKRPCQAGQLDEIIKNFRVVGNVRFVLPVSLADKDVPVLCAAIRYGCTHLLTGDLKDFGHLYDQTVLGVMVVSSERIAEILTAL